MGIEQHYFTWADWDKVGPFHQVFYACVFIADFGPWKKGDEVHSISIDMATSTMTEWDVDGEKMREASIRLVPA